jgi:hypothetical protein
MARSCAKKCGLACLSNCLKGVVSIAFIGLCFYLASLVLAPVRIIGITQLPPGIAYVDHDGRF